VHMKLPWSTRNSFHFALSILDGYIRVNFAKLQETTPEPEGAAFFVASQHIKEALVQRNLIAKVNKSNGIRNYGREIRAEPQISLLPFG
jgi:hypothetical protein